MSKWFERLCNYVWYALVLTLPITSFPILAKVMHSSSVAPASLIFLVILLVVWLPIYLFKKGSFPLQTKAVLAFLIIAFISILLGFFRDIPAYKGQNVLSNTIVSVTTLSMGFFFFLITSVFPNSEEKIKKTLQMLNWGGLVMIIWSIIQVTTLYGYRLSPDWVKAVQGIFSPPILYGIRAMGFASEPSWLAHVLNMVFLPYWLAATLSKYSAFNKRFNRLTAENILLAYGAFTLVLTFSRAGLAAFMLLLAFLFIRFNIWFIKRLSQKYNSKLVRRLFIIGFAFLLFLVYMSIVLLGLYVFSKIDTRMAGVFWYWTWTQGSAIRYFNSLGFGERFSYWQTGWRIFNNYPIFGVGIGNAGFYFPKYIPDGSWQLFEVRKLVYHSASLINIKNLWIRILAETGIVGFSFFVTMLIQSLYSAKVIIKSPNRMKKTIGWMGIFMLMCFTMEGFSIDSFALPYLWFTLGFVAATWRWARSNTASE